MNTFKCVLFNPKSKCVLIERVRTLETGSFQNIRLRGFENEDKHFFGPQYYFGILIKTSSCDTKKLQFFFV